MSAKAEFLSNPRDGVGMPIFLEQDVLNPEALSEVRDKLKNQGIRFGREQQQSFLTWVNFGHPHTVRQLIEEALKSNLDHEEFLGYYGEFLYGLRAECYPDIVGTSSIGSIGTRNRSLVLNVNNDDILEASRRGVVKKTRAFIQSFGIQSVDEAINGTILERELAMKKGLFILLGSTNSDIKIPNLDLSFLQISLSQPHLTHVIFNT